MAILTNVPLAQQISFVELLGRSNFSFLRGASHPEEMVVRAKDLHYRGLGLCDINGLYGVVRGYQAAYKASHFIESAVTLSTDEFQYYVGSELNLSDASSIVLMPLNKDGYARLSRLITRAQLESPKNFSSLQMNDILENADDLLAFPLPPWHEENLGLLYEAFQDRLYLPICRDLTFESIRHNREAFRLEKEKGLPLFVTQRPLMHHSARKPLHDVLTCILHKITLDEAKQRLTLNRERYLRPLHELRALWHDRLDLIQRTVEISSRVQFSLKELRYIYPHEHLPEDQTSAQFLYELCQEGLKWRFPEGAPLKVQAQMLNELKLIARLQYEDYFLTLWDVCNFARQQQILYQGRGSAANSVVCYLIGLTAVDPTKIDLLFERFLSSERGEPPDIDIDFEHERREEVLQYIYRKYGVEHAAMVCNVICYRSRMALREVCKTMGVASETIDSMVRFMGREGLKRIVQTPHEIEKLGVSSEQFHHITQLTAQLLGFPRHLGIHSGGFVISHNPLIENVPIEKATMEGRYVVQWNKDDLAALGMMKIDLLSLGMLTAVRKCLSLLHTHYHRDWNLAQIPPEDSATYAMVQKADTIGVFQIESRAQMSILPRLKPRTYYDLVVEVAIVRPGPILGGMIHPYLKRREGLEQTVYAHPALEPILKRTFGVPIFQEQVMQIVIAVAGFTPGEADELRRIISSSWRSKTLMEGLRQRILGGMLSNGIGREFAEQIYKTIEGFASYGFPESHAASFALITYGSLHLFFA
jgi:DNA polymerase-3 subunit alpha/error-prone DNA polymerase